MNDTSQQGAEITVEGVVQGVGFREFTRRHATELGLSGYVANLRDGRVRVVAEGAAEGIAALVDVLGRGPRHARVARVVLAKRPITNQWRAFSIREWDLDS